MRVCQYRTWRKTLRHVLRAGKEQRGVSVRIKPVGQRSKYVRPANGRAKEQIRLCQHDIRPAENICARTGYERATYGMVSTIMPVEKPIKRLRSMNP